VIPSGSGRAEVAAALSRATPAIAAALEAALGGRDLTHAEALSLCEVRGTDLDALVAAADALRREQAGDVVAYVINRNINFTNACVKACRFCAFSRGQRSEQAYFLDEEEIVRRAVEAASYGATEVCLQAGLPPKLDPGLYARLCRAVKAAAPSLHIHAFSPEEVKYGSGLAQQPVRAYLEELREAGLGSLPGTSAEILDDAVRARISPGRITTAEWISVVTTAHSLGIRTTSTIMFGHVDTAENRVSHLELLRSIQRETGGFTEFVPLSFVHSEAPMFHKGLLPDGYAGPQPDDVVGFYALSRLVLGRYIPHLQASWVKQGLTTAAALLRAGADDLGGTLMNESISTSAGAGHGQLQQPAALRQAIREQGRPPAQRDTLYRTLRAFPVVAGEDEQDALGAVADAEAAFGSFRSMTSDTRFRARRLPVARG
jgi:7,8-didemethyl-8-hydroxy-5-deazariboflavin synthase CofH subunit